MVSRSRVVLSLHIVDASFFWEVTIHLIFMWFSLFSLSQRMQIACACDLSFQRIFSSSSDGMMGYAPTPHAKVYVVVFALLNFLAYPPSQSHYHYSLFRIYWCLMNNQALMPQMHSENNFRFLTVPLNNMNQAIQASQMSNRVTGFLIKRSKYWRCCGGSRYLRKEKSSRFLRKLQFSVCVCANFFKDA